MTIEYLKRELFLKLLLSSLNLLFFIRFDKFIKANNEESKSELELLQEQRDAKRRRIAYRGKRVHTDRK